MVGDLWKNLPRIIDKLIYALVLTLPDGTDGFVVYCNVYCVGSGCVLMQHGNVIAYASR